MKGIFFEKHGGPEVLQYGDLPEPEVHGGQALVDIKAASLNHLDMFVRRGMPGIGIEFPHIPGCDAAGVVVEVGPGVRGLEIGDRVLLDPNVSCGRCEICARGDSSLCLQYKVIGEHTNGTCRERAVFPAGNWIKIPDDLSFVEAASLPMVFVTAWRMLITRGRLRAGEDVLILGAAAGVGIACIQIAKRAGARVIAAAGSAEKLDVCRDLGADVVIDYTQDDWVKRVKSETGKKGVEVVVDYVGEATWPKSIQALARGGRIVTCGATTGYNALTDLRHVFYKQLEIIGSTMGGRHELMAPLRMIFRKEMKPVIGKTFDLKDTADAHRLMEARAAIGKIVITMGA